MHIGNEKPCLNHIQDPLRFSVKTQEQSTRLATSQLSACQWIWLFQIGRARALGLGQFVSQVANWRGVNAGHGVLTRLNGSAFGTLVMSTFHMAI
jgi:hypothetical protein